MIQDIDVEQKVWTHGELGERVAREQYLADVRLLATAIKTLIESGLSESTAVSIAREMIARNGK